MSNPGAEVGGKSRYRTVRHNADNQLSRALNAGAALYNFPGHGGTHIDTTSEGQHQTFLAL